MGRKVVAKHIKGMGWGQDLKSGRDFISLVTETNSETETKIITYYKFRFELGPVVISKVTILQDFIS